jgi:hypothetical protein
MKINKLIYKAGTMIIVISTFFIMCSIGWTATYYVDATNGNDANNGTSELTTWKTIAKVNSSRFNPGDQILFKRGEIWREELIVPSSGADGQPITFGAYSSGAKPRISGEDPTSNRMYCILVNGKNYVSIDNLHTERASGDYAENIYILRSSHITVQNCESEYGGHSGIKILDSPYCIIRNCVTHHNYNTGIFAKQSNNILIAGCISNHNNYKGIDIEAEADKEILNAIVEDCTSHDNKREGIDTDNAYGVIIRRCNVYLNGSDSPDFPGISIGNGTQNATISYSIIHHNFNEGITIEQSGANTGTKIYNDVFYGNGARNIYIKSNNTTIRNCVSMNAGKYLFSVPSGLNITGTSSDYNLFYDSTDFKMTWNGTIYDSLSAFRTASSQESNSKVNDPLFIDAPNGDFRVQNNSVVIDAGTDVGLNQDYDGKSVPKGGAPDIGVYEYQPVVPLASPKNLRSQ